MYNVTVNRGTLHPHGNPKASSSKYVFYAFFQRSNNAFECYLYRKEKKKMMYTRTLSPIRLSISSRCLSSKSFNPPKGRKNSICTYEVIFIWSLESYWKYHPVVDVSSLPAKYNSENVESGWYEWWNEQGLFSAEAQEKNNGPIFSMILPPPNVTGHLHLGHALTATIQDGLIRWWALSIFPFVVWKQLLLLGDIIRHEAENVCKSFLKIFQHLGAPVPF